MAWPYAFVTLTKEEQAQRRELLDWYGSFAQLSVLIPLLVLQMIFLASWLRRKGQNPNTLDTPSSPRVKEAKRRDEGWVGKTRNVRWLSGGSVVLGSDVVESPAEALGAAAWMGWLVYLCFAETGKDYLHLTKRFGIVAASQLPFHYLLAMKSPYSPLQYLSGRSHESLNTLHQFLGRIITILLYAHASLYLNFYVQSNLLATKVKEAYVICGMLGVVAFTVVGTTALAPVRRWSYRVFYGVHVVLASAMLPLLWFHVSHIRIYLYEAAAVHALNVILRSLNSKTFSAIVRPVDNTTLLDIKVPLPSGSGRKVLEHFNPGQHAYISLPGHPASRSLRSNPFSLASIPQTDGQLRFVARVLDGNTKDLARAAKSDPGHELTIEGPYGLADHSTKLLQYDRVLFVAGGVGGTFVAPLYRQLLVDLSPSAGSHRRQKVSFVWVVRHADDVTWAVPAEEKEKVGFLERLGVWVTSASPGSSRSASMDYSHLQSEAGDGIEMEERKGLLNNGGDANGSLHNIDLRSKTHGGRPNLARIVGETFSHSSSERCAVVVCGPRSLSRQVREEVGEWVLKGREVWFWEEKFAM